MFEHGDAMQLTAANLLIASQQLSRGAQQVPRDGQFAATMTKEDSAVGASMFVPSEFGEPQTAAPASKTNAIRNPPGPLGARLDIRV